MSADNIRFIHITDGVLSQEQVSALAAISDYTHRDHHLLPASVASLEQSYLAGKAILALSPEGAWAGFIRLSPLFDNSLKYKLAAEYRGIHAIPDVYEMGTAVTNPELRQNGVSGEARYKLLLNNQELIQGGGLVMGTTKDAIVLHILQNKLGPRLGLNFSFTRHPNLSMLEALTCVCEHPVGQGVHISETCTQRVEPQNIVLIENIVEQIKSGAKVQGTEKGCCLYVHDIQRAVSINQSLLNVFGSQQNFIDALRSIRYYE